MASQRTLPAGGGSLGSVVSAKLGISTDELETALAEISRTSIAAIDDLWTPQTGGDPIAVIDTIADSTAPNPEFSLEETESKERLDSFVEVMKTIAREAAEDPELLKGAPHTRPVRRLDEVKAAKEPVVKHAFEEARLLSTRNLPSSR